MKKRKIDREYIIQLLRTNAALFLLCFIALGVLGILLRGPAKPGSPENNTTPVFSPVVSGAAVPQSAPENLSYSPLKDMPDPLKFQSFVYKKGGSVNISGTCNDLYRVALIYPSNIDYRADPLSAKYNSATPCTKGGVYVTAIFLDPLGLDLGASYYLITASEGKTGTWHDPQ